MNFSWYFGRVGSLLAVLDLFQRFGRFSGGVGQVPKGFHQLLIVWKEEGRGTGISQASFRSLPLSVPMSFRHMILFSARRVERSSSLLLSSSFSLPMTGGERIKFSQMGLFSLLSFSFENVFAIEICFVDFLTFSSFLILFKRGFISINEFDARIHIDQREADHLMSPEGHRQLSLDWQPPSRDSEVMTSKEQVALEGLRENEELEKNDELEDDEWEKSDDWEKNEEKCPIRYEENPLSLREHDGLFL
ncbi:hypothetical protein PRIPAC_91770 [Pristionchus pacificus]|uniref:Uncharacterized protein n=1 Tax=Pristionchus pacificus TaxID=54126 RepID=A0A8R1Z1E4_PRIPA|nr:hypothetical protein PRIPAC_91770 [Pristionchus pacificus]|eukprot:PDM74794.1 hypothetical protein PRIPAC_43384 [Pristionchus pacificus]